jgi:hypothetical protein
VVIFWTLVTRQSAQADQPVESWIVRAFRRALLALVGTALIAAIVRLRGSGGTPPQTGGWRELSGPDLR